GGGTLAGTVSVGGCFSIVSGGSFNLAAGESQTVTVRFSPTEATTCASDIKIESNAGSGSVLIVGEGVAPPHIDTISPPSGTVGTVVTLRGENFGTTPGSSIVKFGSTVASTSSGSATQVQAVVPSLASGSYDVTVTTSSGASNA